MTASGTDTTTLDGVRRHLLTELCCTSPKQIIHNLNDDFPGLGCLVSIPVTFIRLAGESNDAVNSLRTEMGNCRSPGLEY